mmetsp:Transcript_23967/g.58179  ORF Transcript_23967/g.58179 Transcript_23967/m.58179 type:complete len:260 (-) Transcript_23967:180-959(-)
MVRHLHCFPAARGCHRLRRLRGRSPPGDPGDTGRTQQQRAPGSDVGVQVHRGVHWNVCVGCDGGFERRAGRVERGGCSVDRCGAVGDGVFPGGRQRGSLQPSRDGGSGVRQEDEFAGGGGSVCGQPGIRRHPGWRDFLGHHRQVFCAGTSARVRLGVGGGRGVHLHVLAVFRGVVGRLLAQGRAHELLRAGDWIRRHRGRVRHRRHQRWSVEPGRLRGCGFCQFLEHWTIRDQHRVQHHPVGCRSGGSFGVLHHPRGRV